MVVRFYAYAQRSSSTGGTLSNPGGTWTTRLNLVSNIAAFNCGLVVADRISGTDNQTITSDVAGAFMVVDVALTAAVTTSQGMRPARVHPGKGPGFARFLQSQARSFDRPIANPVYGDQLLPYS